MYWNEAPELGERRKFLVPLITNDAGSVTAPWIYRSKQRGKILWLFSSRAWGYTVIDVPMKSDKAAYSRFLLSPYLPMTSLVFGLLRRIKEANKAYMDVLEQGGGRYTSSHLNFGKHFDTKTVPELWRFLENNEVDQIVVDPGFPGEKRRTYYSPHKA